MARSPEDVVKRLDAFVREIRSKHHTEEAAKSDEGFLPSDVVVVAQGQILRALAMRWVGKPLTDTSLILEAGGVGTLR